MKRFLRYGMMLGPPLTSALASLSVVVMVFIVLSSSAFAAKHAGAIRQWSCLLRQVLPPPPIQQMAQHAVFHLHGRKLVARDWFSGDEQDADTSLFWILRANQYGIVAADYSVASASLGNLTNYVGFDIIALDARSGDITRVITDAWVGADTLVQFGHCVPGKAAP